MTACCRRFIHSAKQTSRNDNGFTAKPSLYRPRSYQLRLGTDNFHTSRNAQNINCFRSFEFSDITGSLFHRLLPIHDKCLGTSVGSCVKRL